MKTFILKTSAFVCGCLFFSTALISTSCNKDKTCHGKVHVVDTAGMDVYNANVKLYAPGGDVVYESTTDGSGEVIFDVKLPAIFDVLATKSIYPNMAGVGVLRLDEPGTDEEIDVTIQ